MELLALRHGQASFGAADYDQLSPLGVIQAEAFGRWLAATDQRFDVVVSGAMRRHAQTLDALAQHAPALPQASVDAAFDEFDHQAMLKAFAKIAPGEAGQVHLVPGTTRPDSVALFRFLKAGLGAWVAGTLDADLPESFGAFRARVLGGLARLVDASGNAKRVLLVSSGGVMSQLAQHALGVPDSHATDLNLGIRNAALAEFRHAGDRLRLLAWNAQPHLALAPREHYTHY